jgi:ubiquinone/menaquinone biosynthesis C-methylase UbiE
MAAGSRARALSAALLAALLTPFAALACASGQEPHASPRPPPPATEPPATPPVAETAQELPPPLEQYMGRPVAQVMHWKGAEWLLRATRESEEHTSRLLEALAVKPGDRVCDFGCGVGYLSLPLAERVGDAGEVIAVDIQPEMLVQLEERAKAAGVKRIRTVLGGDADPKLEPASCDLVLMVDVYHELSYPEQILSGVKRALAPGGRLVLVEFRAEDPAIPIKPEHKMASAQVERELAANGWRLASSFEDLPWQHVLTFQPVEASAEESGSVGFFDSFGEEAHDGAWLYERNCSGCHGLTGAGDGETAKALGVQPRDFVKGGFSFGNTRESLFRTISSGIPGRSVMPSFAGTLSEDERWLVVDHVRTLMPPESEADARASVLEVHDRPVVARGKLPPLAEGQPEFPRGLLVGLPSGLTFEYDIDNVRLLAVRMGSFADREDWRDRGGGYLRPTGQLVAELYWEASGPLAIRNPWTLESGRGSSLGVSAALRSTTVRDQHVDLEYDLVGAPFGVQVVEDVSTVPTSKGPAFARRFVLRGPANPWECAMYPLEAHNIGELRELPFESDWKYIVATTSESGAVLLGFHGDCEVSLREGPAWRPPLQVYSRSGSDHTASWEMIALPTSDLGDEELTELAKELTR